jgi:hypothetical protein
LITITLSHDCDCDCVTTAEPNSKCDLLEHLQTISLSSGPMVALIVACIPDTFPAGGQRQWFTPFMHALSKRFLPKAIVVFFCLLCTVCVNIWLLSLDL